MSCSEQITQDTDKLSPEQNQNTERTQDSGPIAKSFINRSDIFFTQPNWNELEKGNQGKYAGYYVDAIMWGFLPPTFSDFDYQTNFDSSMAKYVNSITKHKRQGVGWVSRIEWDVIWVGMTSKYPDTYHQAMVKRLDGEDLEIDWFPGHYFFSSHSPLFLDYIKWQIQDVAFYSDKAGPSSVDAILFDSQQSSPAYYHWGGDFSEASMANFNSWLSENYTPTELRSLLELSDDQDITTFHYGTYLKNKGYTSATYESETANVPNNIPLNNEFRHFLQDWNNRYLAELVKFTDEVAKAKGYQHKEGVGYIEVGTSSPLLERNTNAFQ
jgi:hypothetical protein